MIDNKEFVYVPAPPGWWIRDEHNPTHRAPLLALGICREAPFSPEAPYIAPITDGNINDWQVTYETPSGEIYDPFMGITFASYKDSQDRVS